MKTAVKHKQWIIANDISEIKEKTASDQHGVVYAVEYGEHIKIGYTKDLIKRVKSFLRNTKYGDLSIKRIVYTAFHSNFTENERLLHDLFREFRIKGTELFAITLNDFLLKAPELHFDETVFDYENEVRALKKAIVPSNAELIDVYDNKALTAKEYNGQRVVTFQDVDYIHGRAKGTAKVYFSRSKQNFIEGVDYFNIKPADLKFSSNTIVTAEINNFGTIFITQMGYLMLVKSFNDKLSWVIQRMLVVKYFDKPNKDTAVMAVVENLFKNKEYMSMGEINDLIVETSFADGKEKAPVGQQPTEGKTKEDCKVNELNSDIIIPQNNGNVKDLSQESENKFYCNIDRKSYKDKETAKRETGTIVKRMKNKDRIKQMTAEQLANAVQAGYSFTTAALNGTTEAHFVSQQLAVVDIDNENKDVPVTTIEDAEKVLAEHGIKYSFMYFSFSHSTITPKFRIVCILKESIADPAEAKRLNQYLISLFPQADKSCFNLDRFYYGTCNGLATEVHDRTTTINVPADFMPLEPEPQTLDVPENESPPPPEPPEQDADHTAPPMGEQGNEPKPKSKAKKEGQTGNSALGEAIRSFDLCGYVEQTTGTQGARHGKDVLFNPCPLCGHNDHFYIDTEKNTYYSHGDKDIGKHKGNIINYIMAKDGITKEEARDYFLYTILGRDREAEKKAFKEGKQSKKQAQAEPPTDENIDLYSLSAWEEITSKDLLLKILSKADKTDIAFELSVLRTTAKGHRRAAEFDKLVKALQDELKRIAREKFLEENPNGLYFTDCPILLNCSKYRGNDNGVYSMDICIIPQPLVITKRTVEIESGIMKVELAARIKGKWELITVDREIIASRTKIVSLANNGVMVTTENADMIVNYLQTLQVENEDAIPTVKAVSHMGYIMDKTDIFVPYTEDLIYNGDTAYSGIFKAVHTKGDFKTWVNLVKEVRNDSLAARVALATSFASPLIHFLDKLNFFTHIWGTSDTGKSVDLSLAASVWGQPNKYLKNLNTTGVGFERNAYFFHNLPFILDELQTVKNDKLSQLIYSGTQGQGRMRGTVRGIEKLLTWRLAFLTAGEQPLTNNSSGTGEINRIIDIYVKGRVFKDPSKVYDITSKNYGYAGKYFIENLKNYNLDEMIQKWEAFVQCENEKTSGKQRMSASLLLCADELFNSMFLKQSPLEAGNTTVEFWEMLSEVLADAKEADQTKRAYEFVVGWVAENNIKFTDDSLNERWGRFSGKTQVLISNNALENALQKAGFNYRAILKGFAERDYIIPSDGKEKKNTKTIRMNGQIIKGVELKLDEIEPESDSEKFKIFPNPYQAN